MNFVVYILFLPMYSTRKQLFAVFRSTNVVVRWPGAAHDAFIPANLALPDILDGINRKLLGDSGYPLKK